MGLNTILTSAVENNTEGSLCVTQWAIAVEQIPGFIRYTNKEFPGGLWISDKYVPTDAKIGGVADIYYEWSSGRGYFLAETSTVIKLRSST